MATRPPLSCLIGFVLIAASAACGDDTPAPTGPTQATVLLEVPVSGTVHDTSDRPIQGATVIASVEGLSRLKRTTETGQDGRFTVQIPAPLNPVKVSLHTSAAGFTAPAWETTYFPGADIIPEIRMQRRLSLSVGEAISGVVLPGDPVWILDDGHRCGPCQQVAVSAPNGARSARVVSVTWTGQSNPRLLVEGMDAEYEGYLVLGEQHSHKRLEATIPAMSSAWAYVGIAGDSLSEPIPYEISVRWAFTGVEQ